MVLAVLLVMAAAGVAWKAADVRRDPRSLERWAFLGALVCVTLTLVLEVSRQYPQFTFGLDPRLLRLGQNIVVIGAFGSLQLFYLHYVAAYLPRPRLGLEVALIGATMVGLTVLTIRVIDLGQNLGTGPGNVAQPAVAGFYLLGGIYISYALATQLWWTARFSRVAAIAPGVRRAAKVAAVGAAILLIGELLRTLSVAYVAGTGGQLRGIEGISVGLILLGTPVLIAGLVLPVITTSVTRALVRRRQRRAHRGLEALWQAVRYVYPELIRPDRPAPEPTSDPRSRTARRRPRAIRRTARITAAFYTRIGQCREGYLRVQPYLGPDAETASGERVAAFAAELHTAPTINLDQPDPDDSSPPEPRGPYRGLPADTESLLEISRVLRGRGLAWCDDTTSRSGTSVEQSTPHSAH